jgi:hypothetical protein
VAQPLPPPPTVCLCDRYVRGARHGCSWGQSLGLAPFAGPHLLFLLCLVVWLFRRVRCCGCGVCGVWALRAPLRPAPARRAGPACCLCHAGHAL